MNRAKMQDKLDSATGDALAKIFGNILGNWNQGRTIVEDEAATGLRRIKETYEIFAAKIDDIFPE